MEYQREETTGMRTRYCLICLFIVLYLMVSIPSYTTPPIPGLYSGYRGPSPNALPVLRGTVSQQVGISGIERITSQNKMIIHQKQKQAILNWNSFDIGKGAWTHFDQKKNPDWVALNRIYDNDPSLIFGKLTADGKIFLINQNGIMFGRSSHVNVHGLVASSLNISDDDFLNGIFKFKTEDYANQGITETGCISNHGIIETDTLGNVYLLGSKVENGGLIIAPSGTIIMAAGRDVERTYDGAGNLQIQVNDPGNGSAVNFQQGALVADAGTVGMFGRVVNQKGMIRSITALKKRGKIFLKATERIETGERSLTETPVSSSNEKAHKSFKFQGGEIDLGGLKDDEPVEYIEHNGTIAAPSGVVSMSASKRIYLGKDSNTDVSGLWVAEPMDNLVIEAQLNSVELRDDYGQKNGPLKSSTIKTLATWGSSIGDISGHLYTEEMTAAERAVTGGEINLRSDGDIIMRDGSKIDFSGGGFNYGAGLVSTTYLASANHIYSISDAPEWVHYDAILDSYTKIYPRYGMSVEFHGLFYGAGTPILNYCSDITSGNDAGRLSIRAPVIVANAAIDGSVVKGLLQTRDTEPEDDKGREKARGYIEPKGGTLSIGASPEEKLDASQKDHIVKEITVQKGKQLLPYSFEPGDILPWTVSYLSSDLITKAGLSALNLSSNLGIHFTQDADIVMEPGSSISLLTRTIDFQGKITAPGGNVNLTIWDNKTSPGVGANPSDVVELNERIQLSRGSSISVKGENSDLSKAAALSKGIHVSGHTDGGTVSLMDKSRAGLGVIIENGADIDVSGGYTINSQEELKPGNAGMIKVQGRTVILDGNLKGLAIRDGKGGTLSIHANRVDIVKNNAPHLPPDFTFNSEIPQGLKGCFVMEQDRFALTGFSDISLSSFGDLSVKEGASVMPSAAKAVSPIGSSYVATQALDRNYAGEKSIVTVDPDGTPVVIVRPEYVRESAIRLAAGKAFDIAGGLGSEPSQTKKLTIYSNSKVEAAPGGTLELKGPIVEVSGNLVALSGNIRVESSAEGGIHLHSGSSISAQGWNRPLGVFMGNDLPTAYRAEEGGNVSLVAPYGSIYMDNGARINVSGSDPVISVYRNLDGTIFFRKIAGAAGEIALSYLNDLVLSGNMAGQSKLPGLKGGELSISRLNYHNPLLVDTSQVAGILNKGFDGLTLRGIKGISFSGSTPIKTDRFVKLDAPRVDTETGDVTIHSPWITLTNTTFPDDGVLVTGDAIFNIIAGEFIDVDGSVCLSGFDRVNLKAGKDLRLSDRYYSYSNKRKWAGELKSSGEILLYASRIYPGTLAEFTISTPGTIRTVQGGNYQAPVLSAGGMLTLEGSSIIHEGTLAAPMGRIVLRSTSDNGRIFLAKGSRIVTKGDYPIDYGSADELFWTITDKVNMDNMDGIPVEEAPAKSIEIKAEGENGEVVVAPDAEIDVSGGGYIFSAYFIPDINGTMNPLEKEGRYIIVPGIDLPGNEIRITGGKGFLPGNYSILPSWCAFMPGAYVLEDLGLSTSLTQEIMSPEGFPTSIGYFSFTGALAKSPLPHIYSVRKAADVLKEGKFVIHQAIAGDAGDIEIYGRTVVMGGKTLSLHSKGYNGGNFAVTAENIQVVPVVTSLLQGLGPEAPLPDELLGTAVISTQGISGMGVHEIVLGDQEKTKNIQVENGAVLTSDTTVLSAKDIITVKSGATINGTGENGRVVINSPEGHLVVEEGAKVHATHEVVLNTPYFQLDGEVSVDNSRLTLEGSSAFFVPEDFDGDLGPGTYFTDLVSRFNGFDDILFRFDKDITFVGDTELDISSSLVLDTPLIRGLDGGYVRVASRHVGISNTWGSPSSGDTPLTDASTMTIEAREIAGGPGSITLDGFSAVNMISQGDIAFAGKGEITIDGEVNLQGSRITTTTYNTDSTGTQNADFSLQSLGHAVNISRSPIQASTEKVPGGILSITAATITNAGVIDIPGGRIFLSSTGNAADGNGIFLSEGSVIKARGTDMAPGGTIRLDAGNGLLHIQGGSLLDVSAGDQGDAGAIEIKSPNTHAILGGIFAGQGGSDGRGGSLILDTDKLDDLSSFLQLTTAGGFTHKIGIRARKGDLTVGQNDTIHAANISLAADGKDGDGGDIDIQGVIDASGARGGNIELHARKDLNLNSGSVLRASSTDEERKGGSILLNSATGTIHFNEGALIDVSAGNDGRGGDIHFRALRTEGGDDVKMSLSGIIRGAARILAEAVKVFQDSSISSGDVSTYRSDTQSFINNHGDNIKNRLLNYLTLDGTDALCFHLLPGIEVVSHSNLSLYSNLDLTSWRYGGEPGVLTLRAGDRLYIARDIVDHPTSITDLQEDPVMDSWAINLVAGADMDAADYMATRPGTGDLRFSNTHVVYTESAPIHFAAGRDMIMGPGKIPRYMVSYNMGYNLATYDADIKGEIGRDLTIDRGAIQSATGNIHLDVDGNISLQSGSIRTTGYKKWTEGSSSHSWDLLFYWEYGDGGNIILNVAHSITAATIEDDSWDKIYYGKFWGADYDSNPTNGIAAMGGGDVKISTGGDFYGRAGVFGKSDDFLLDIHSGGNIDGRFTVKRGDARLNTYGTYGTRLENSAVEAFDSHIDITSWGDMELGTVLNPTISMPGSEGHSLEYTEDASVTLRSLRGDISLTGKSRHYHVAGYHEKYQGILPPNVSINAAGDINLRNSFVIPPSPQGGLTLEAGGDINGVFTDSNGRITSSMITMSDANPESVYGTWSTANTTPTAKFNELVSYHASVPVHSEDLQPVCIDAGGNIGDLRLILPKMAHISAGGDIKNLYLNTQNLRATDITFVRAGGDIIMSTRRTSSYTGLLCGGPGYFLIQGGGSIDLGTTKGIQSLGNYYNYVLGAKGSSIIVLAGTTKDIQPEDVYSFFDSIRDKGIEYSKELGTDKEYALSIVDEARKNVIEPFFAGSPKGKGDINMVRSQIMTVGSDSDISIVSTGTLNIGKSAIGQNEATNTGITTEVGGAINIFSTGDINVLESRVMTKLGGDITVWSDQGNINAGRGSKTAINASKPIRVWKEDHWEIFVKPVAVGSGIRTLTYDPDGYEGPEEAPPPGDAYLFAPQGVIDAGEAGISAGNVILGATEVLNTQNISFSVASVGVPASSQGSSAIGSLAGSGAIAATSRIGENMAGVASKRKGSGAGKNSGKAFLTNWVEVKVLSIGL